jgi:hypothetical protein
VQYRADHTCCPTQAEIFLAEAQDRAAAVGKKAFCHVVGLGLGVWQVDPKQQQIMASNIR